MKVLWLNINASYSHTCLSIPALHAQISSSVADKTEWKVITGTINREFSFYLKDIIEFNPSLILATSWLFNHDYLLTLLTKTAALLKNRQIILGGPEYLGDNENYLRTNTFVTAVFRGEGEDIFSEFIDRISDGRIWNTLPGFCYIDKEGNYKDNGIAQVLNFADLKAPESSDLFDWNKPFVQLETSRGCFNRCSFCISGKERKIDNISIQSIKERLDVIRERRVKEVRILDRTFNANSKRAKKVLFLFKEYWPDICFHLEIHPSLLDDHIRETLKSLPEGLLHIEAGMQSLDENVIAECRRSGTAESSFRGLVFLTECKNFEVHTDLIAGLPGYSYSKLIEDVSRLTVVNPDEIQLELLKLLPGTHLRETASERGIIFSSEPPYEVLKTDDITYHQLNQCVILSKILDTYFNGGILKESFRNLVAENSVFLDKFISHCEFCNFDFSSSSDKKALFLLDFCYNNFEEYKIHLIQDWIMSGLPHNKGAGKMLKLWKFGEKPENPLLIDNQRDLTYKYFEINNKRYWFSFNKYVNSYKPISNFIELL
jgi:radical SAM superfamily enzyme